MMENNKTLATLKDSNRNDDFKIPSTFGVNKHENKGSHHNTGVTQSKPPRSPRKAVNNENVSPTKHYPRNTNAGQNLIDTPGKSIDALCEKLTSLALITPKGVVSSGKDQQVQPKKVRLPFSEPFVGVDKLAASDSLANIEDYLTESNNGQMKSLVVTDDTEFFTDAAEYFKNEGVDDAEYEAFRSLESSPRTSLQDNDKMTVGSPGKSINCTVDAFPSSNSNVELELSTTEVGNFSECHTHSDVPVGDICKEAELKDHGISNLCKDSVLGNSNLGENGNHISGSTDPVKPVPKSPVGNKSFDMDTCNSVDVAGVVPLTLNNPVTQAPISETEKHDVVPPQTEPLGDNAEEIPVAVTDDEEFADAAEFFKHEIGNNICISEAHNPVESSRNSLVETLSPNNVDGIESNMASLFIEKKFSSETDNSDDNILGVVGPENNANLISETVETSPKASRIETTQISCDNTAVCFIEKADNAAGTFAPNSPEKSIAKCLETVEPQFKADLKDHDVGDLCKDSMLANSNLSENGNHIFGSTDPVKPVPKSLVGNKSFDVAGVVPLNLNNPVIQAPISETEKHDVVPPQTETLGDNAEEKLAKKIVNVENVNVSDIKDVQPTDNIPTVEAKPDNIPTVEAKPDNIPTVEAKPDNIPTVEAKPDNIPTVDAKPTDNIPTVDAKPTDNVPVVDAKPTDNVPVVDAKPTDNVPAVDAKPTDNVPVVEAKPTDNVPVVEAKPTDNVPVVEAKPTDNVPVVEAKPTDNVPVVEAKPTDNVPVVEAKPTDNVPVVEAKPTDNVPVVEAKPTDNVPVVEAKPTDNVPVVEAKPTDNVPVVEAKPTDNVPVVEAKPTDNVPVVEAKPTNVPVVEAKPTDNVPVVEAEPTDDVPFVEAKPTDNVPVVEAKPTDNVPVVEAKPTDNVPVVEAKPTDNVPVVEAKPTDNVPVVEAKPTDNVPVVEAEPTDNVPVVEAEPTDNVPVVEAEPTDNVPVVEAKPTDNVPVVEAKPDNVPVVEAKPDNVPVVKAKPTDNVPVVEAKPTDNVPVVEAKPTDDVPVVEAKPTDDVPVVEAKSTDDVPVVEAKSTDDVPVVEAKPTDDVPVVEAKPTDDVPVVEAKPTDDVPVVEAKPTDNVPVVEAKPTDNVPTVEAKPTDNVPVVEAKPTDNVPTVEAKPTDNVPTVEAKPTDNVPVVEAKPTDNVPVVETIPTDNVPVVVATVEAKPTDNVPTVEAKPTDNVPVVEAKPTDNVPTVEAKPTDNVPVVEAKPTDNVPVVVTVEAKPTDNVPTVEAKPTDNVPVVETIPTDNVPVVVATVEAKPTDNVATVEAKSTDNVATVEAKPTDNVATVEAKPTDNVATVEAKPTDNVATVEVKPTDNVPVVVTKPTENVEDKSILNIDNMDISMVSSVIAHAKNNKIDRPEREIDNVSDNVVVKVDYIEDKSILNIDNMDISMVSSVIAHARNNKIDNVAAKIDNIEDKSILDIDNMNISMVSSVVGLSKSNNIGDKFKREIDNVEDKSILNIDNMDISMVSSVIAHANNNKNNIDNSKREINNVVEDKSILNIDNLNFDMVSSIVGPAKNNSNTEDKSKEESNVSSIVKIKSNADLENTKLPDDIEPKDEVQQPVSATPTAVHHMAVDEKSPVCENPVLKSAQDGTLISGAVNPIKSSANPVRVEGSDNLTNSVSLNNSNNVVSGDHQGESDANKTEPETNDSKTAVADTPMPSLRFDLAEPIITGLAAEKTPEAKPDFKIAQDFICDDNDWDLLNSNKSIMNATRLCRESLYMKFDPLLGVNTTADLEISKAKPVSKQPALKSIKSPPQSPDLIMMDSPTRKSMYQKASAMRQAVNPSSTKNVDDILFLSPQNNGNVPFFGTPLPQKRSEIIEVLKYTEDDWLKMKQNIELEYQNRLMSASQELTMKISEINEQHQNALNDKNIELEQLKKDLEEAKTEKKGCQDKVAEMKIVLDDYSTLLDQLAAEKMKYAEKYEKKIDGSRKEVDLIQDELQTVQKAYSDLLRRFEKAKTIIEGFKKNEETLKNHVTELTTKMKEDKKNWSTLMKESKETQANLEKEVAALKKKLTVDSSCYQATNKRKDMKIAEQENDLERKKNQIEELTKICDDLMEKVGDA
ncbi:serine/arginine repetitive matrix protein 2-like isoform X1 [Argonauta hians]